MPPEKSGLDGSRLQVLVEPCDEPLWDNAYVIMTNLAQLAGTLMHHVDHLREPACLPPGVDARSPVPITSWQNAITPILARPPQRR